MHDSVEKFYPCDYVKCSRAKGPFTRKDHYRDHLKDYHKEDLGAAKGERAAKTVEQKRKWQKAQEVWRTERKIRPNQWRCVKCLYRVYVDNDGWNCPMCHQECEIDRQKSRNELHAAPSSLSCNNCSGTRWIIDILTQSCNPCPNCQPLSELTYIAADTSSHNVSDSMTT